MKLMVMREVTRLMGHGVSRTTAIANVAERVGWTFEDVSDAHFNGIMREVLDDEAVHDKLSSA